MDCVSDVRQLKHDTEVHTWHFRFFIHYMGNFKYERIYFSHMEK